MTYNMRNCPEVPLTSLLSFIVDNRGKTVPTAESGHVLIATNCIRNEYLYPIYEKVRYLSEETYQTWFRAHPEPGDIIFVNKGTPGRVCMVPDPVDFCIAQDMMAFRVDPTKVYNKYLLAILRSERIQKQIDNSQVGTLIPHFKKANLKTLMIPVPDMEIQHKIGDFYFLLSEKMEINRTINQMLERLAQETFRDQFVDFSVFDEPYKESPLGGEIPESLEMVQIGELHPILETGKRPKGGAVAEGIPSVGAENVKQLGEFNSANAKYIPFDFAKTLSKGKVCGYEVMIYKDGGKPGTFIPHFSMFGEGFPYDEFYINEHVFKLDFGDRGYNGFIYLYFHTDYVMNWLANNGGKAAIPGINQNDIRSIYVFDPSHPKVKSFCKWVQPIFKTILSNCAENMRMTELRDTILPRLVSGEIDVSGLRL